MLKGDTPGEMSFFNINIQNVFPLHSDSFVYLLSIKFTFISKFANICSKWRTFCLLPWKRGSA